MIRRKKDITQLEKKSERTLECLVNLSQNGWHEAMAMVEAMAAVAINSEMIVVQPVKNKRTETRQLQLQVVQLLKKEKKVLLPPN